MDELALSRIKRALKHLSDGKRILDKEGVRIDFNNIYCCVVLAATNLEDAVELAEMKSRFSEGE